MKRLLACTMLGMALSVPNFAQADDYDYRHHVIVHGPLGVVGNIVALPFVAGAAVIGAAATIATAPFYALDGSEPAPPPPAPAYYAPPRPAYYAPPAVYVAPRPVYYAPPPVYVAPRPVYYAPPRVYYRPAPVYAVPAYPPAY